MVNDRMPRSQKSNRGHDRFKDLYASTRRKKDYPATTPELANRAPRQVAQSVTPSSEGTTTGNECTPVSKTPKKAEKPKTKKAKWAHVPSASDGDVTHFENFENDGKAQLAVAKIKTRELQWKSKDSVEVQSTATDRSSDAMESYRQELDPTSDSSGGTGGSAGSAGSTDELRLKPSEQTQDDDREIRREVTQDDPDQREVRHDVIKAPSPPKVQLSKEAIKTVDQPPPPVQQLQQPMEVANPQPVKKEMSKKEQRRPMKGSSRENRKTTTQVVSSNPQPPQNNDNTTSSMDKSQARVKKEGAEPTSANYLTALKLMKILKRNNYLENALRFEDSEKVRKHFESVGFSQPPPPQILTLLNRAMEFVLETVLFRADDLDTCITNDLRVFIIKKQEARESMLEVIFHRPDLMPNKWGGSRVEANRSKNSKGREGGKKGWFSSFFR